MSPESPHDFLRGAGKAYFRSPPLEQVEEVLYLHIP